MRQSLGLLYSGCDLNLFQCKQVRVCSFQHQASDVHETLLTVAAMALQINELIYDINDAGDFLERNRILNFDWDEKFTHSLLSINFQSDSDQQLRNIHGDLILVNSNPINYYSTFSGTLSHRSFAVGFPETIKDKFKLKATESVRSLFPKWFSYLSNLNLTGSACLSITPDRCDFTVDENFKVLKYFIWEFMITIRQLIEFDFSIYKIDF